MKKLASVVMMMAIATLMAAMASADGHHWRDNHHSRRIQGVYALSATGTCLNSWLAPIVDGSMPEDVWGASNMVQGFFTFERDGTGNATGNNYPMIPPPAPRDNDSPFVFPRVGVFRGAFSFDFTYQVTHDGAITVWVTPGTFKGRNPVTGAIIFTGDNCGADKCAFFGMVSSDDKTLTLASWNPQAYTYLPSGPTQYTICHMARILIRVSDQDDD